MTTARLIAVLLGLARQWPSTSVGLVLAFGAGALISAVSFDLAEEGIDIGGGDSVGLGLALGALTYFTADRLVERMGRPKRHGAKDGGTAPAGGDAGTGLALGAFLDGIPEQLVLGIGIAAGDGVSVGLLVAIFISNLPEAIGSSTGMSRAGRGRGAIMRLWIAVAVVVRARDGRGMDDRRHRVGRPAGDDRRVRRRRAARDAHRLDDPRGRAARGQRRGPGDGVRLRGGCRALQPRLTAAT